MQFCEPDPQHKAVPRGFSGHPKLVIGGFRDDSCCKTSTAQKKDSKEAAFSFFALSITLPVRHLGHSFRNTMP